MLYLNFGVRSDGGNERLRVLERVNLDYHPLVQFEQAFFIGGAN